MHPLWPEGYDQKPLWPVITDQGPHAFGNATNPDLGEGQLNPGRTARRFIAPFSLPQLLHSPLISWSKVSNHAQYARFLPLHCQENCSKQGQWLPF